MCSSIRQGLIIEEKEKEQVFFTATAFPFIQNILWEQECELWPFTQENQIHQATE